MAARPGPLPDGAAAKLLMAAACFDIGFVYVLSKMISGAASTTSGRSPEP